MFLIAYYLILLLVTSYAIASKRRFERYVGGLLILNSLLTTTMQRLFHDLYPLYAILANDVLLLTALSWILWRYRRPWIWAITGIEAVIVALDVSQIAGGIVQGATFVLFATGLAYAQLVSLGLGVVWRTYGPPAEPPEPAAPPVES